MTKSASIGTLVLTLISALILTGTSAFAETKTLQDVYNESVVKYNAGQYEEALKGFELILKKKPGYVYARNYAVKCQNAIKAGATPAVDIEGQLSKIKIASVDFNKTELGTVLEYLSQKSDELSDGKVAANIVYQGSEEDRKKPVTLQLRNVPITEVLTYVGRLTGTNFKYEKYAVVGTPVRGSTSTSATTVQPIKTEGGKKFDTFTAPPDPFKKK